MIPKEVKTLSVLHQIKGIEKRMQYLESVLNHTKTPEDDAADTAKQGRQLLAMLEEHRKLSIKLSALRQLALQEETS